MTFRRFFYLGLGVAAAVVLAFVAFNVSMNEFGLFGDVRGKQIRIWTAEKTSKYLLSFNYIPANFNAVMVGPSLSDQLDTRKLRGHKVYNLSTMGANVRELKLLLSNTLEHGRIDLVIICLHPYLTHDNILKDKRMTPQIYWSTLGSSFTFKLYNDKIKNLINSNNDSFTDSVAGYSRPIQKVVSVEAAIDHFAEGIKKSGGVQSIDPTAFADLREIIDQARTKGVRIVAYYHPDPYKVFGAYEERYRKYQERINTLFTPEDLVWDFNTPAYDGFRKDFTNYIDHGHLSVKGGDFVLSELNRLIEQAPHRTKQIPGAQE